MKRGLDVRDFTLTTFGGSGSLLLCRLVDVLGLRAVPGSQMNAEQDLDVTAP